MLEEKVMRHRTLTRKQVAKIPLAEEEHQKLIQPPKLSVERFRKREQDANDWYIVTFRIKIGLQVAIKDYEQETIEFFEKAHQVCMECLTKYRQDEKYNWTVSTLDFVTIHDAVDAVEQLQRETSRETLMFVTRKVYADMQKYTED